MAKTLLEYVIRLRVSAGGSRPFVLTVARQRSSGGKHCKAEVRKCRCGATLNWESESHMHSPVLALSAHRC